MRPLSLKGHDRALTRVRLNREGDLLFSSGKDKSSCVWLTENGERVGTYDGHNGVIWDLDVSFDSNFLVTASGDDSVKIWDCATGQMISSISTLTGARAISLSYSANLIGYTTIKMTQNQASLCVVDKRDSSQITGVDAPAMKEPLQIQANSCVWNDLDYKICTGNEKGHIDQFDLRTGITDTCNKESHKYQINDMQMSDDLIFLITASKDKTACLFDAFTLKCLKTYKSERPVNSAAISPTRDHIILGGGEEAMKVTQTSVSSGHFEAKLYHMVFEEEFARFKGHFGPINTLAFHPNGTSIVTGGEDGFVRIQEFDSEYLNFDYDFWAD